MFNPFRRFLRPRLNTPEHTPPAEPPVETGEPTDGGTYLTQYAFTIKWQIMEERMQTTNLILVAVFLVLMACFIGLYFDYQQFKAVSYKDYSEGIKELQNERYELLQQKYDFLESQVKAATGSAR